MKELFSDVFFGEIQSIYRKAEKVINDDIIDSISTFKDFKKNPINEVEYQIKKLEIEYCKDDLKYKKIINIIKLLLNIIKYNK